MTTLYDLQARKPDGSAMPMNDYAGKVLLIVNTASKCGFTPQYEGLEELYRDYKDQGLEVLAFPCNQFGNQEPGSNEEIAEFCSLNFSTSFPLFDKVEVNGDDTDPLWRYLKSQQSGLMGSKAIKWNFTKFLVDRSGKVVARHGSMVKPEQLRKDIEALLKQ
ncbi:glutathione peroxidase [Alterisphingorhabdus coralli]|uniref:Glutathione peroxidase n=1 Tax=Alterisphingorhabdus coralli TaxID=3071408 RepID=A0AA97F637_9SPHN|nr:glutathione peroxidase [Parasphingorhabdus sp. SCSIO 66989]WOE73957.1 glutathione peroxidase [Parasphingorhabdus sp. SCSIO 66989]